MNLIRRYFLRALFLFTTLPFWFSQKVPQSKSLSIIPVYQDSIYSGPVKIKTLQNKEIDEASGIAFSKTLPGIIYTHNDSGGEPLVYMMDTLGKDKGAIRLEGVWNRDWEDIAVGPGPRKGISYVYVGEIGDNGGKYKNIKIFRFAEPKHWEEKIDVVPEVAILTYPDGPKDAETLMVDPVSTDIFIVSKRDSINILYKTTQKAFGKDKVVLERIMDLPFTMAVAGDISSDGSQIVIKNYFTVFFWERGKGESIPEALSRKPLILPYKPEPQGEAIAFHPSGNSYYTLSEKRFGIHPTLYRYNKK